MALCDFVALYLNICDMLWSCGLRIGRSARGRLHLPGRRRNPGLRGTGWQGKHELPSLLRLQLVLERISGGDPQQLLRHELELPAHGRSSDLLGVGTWAVSPFDLRLPTLRCWESASCSGISGLEAPGCSWVAHLRCCLAVWRRLAGSGTWTLLGSTGRGHVGCEFLFRRVPPHTWVYESASLSVILGQRAPGYPWVAHPRCWLAV